MQLESFRVFNYRSINDSGNIDVSRITAMLGRNESGKTNLLLALHSLNPAQGIVALEPIKDFPRHRPLSECTETTKVLTTSWVLDKREQQELTGIFPRAKGVQKVIIGRYYSNKRFASFVGLSALTLDTKQIATTVKNLKASIVATAKKLEEPAKTQVEEAYTKFESEIKREEAHQSWAVSAAPILNALRQALSSAGVKLTEKQNTHLTELEKLANTITGDAGAEQKALNWAVSRLPVFIYLDDYPEIDGHQDIAAYLHRHQHQQLTDTDRNFEKLCKVAGLNPRELNTLLSQQQQETRNQLANRAGAVVTREIRRLWQDRSLKIRFDLDANHINTLISDPNDEYDVEVNLNERSRGFKWFFSFYITFSADTDGGAAENAILLLDEPGLFLHAASQEDLLVHLDQDFSNQILYTTHSPFMVPTRNLDAVRTVNISQQEGTTVTNDPTGDARTLFPLQAAIGYYLSQSMFTGPANLIIEGVTDYWIIAAIAEYLAAKGNASLPSDLVLTPAGGAQKVSYMVALLTSQRLNVLVLFDEEKQARSTKDELVKSKLIREENIAFISEAFDPPANEADVEDLLDADVYETLVRESYAKELHGKTLKLNPRIPRVAKRVETGLTELGLEFHKSRPARLLLKKMASEPETIVTAATAERFTRLFSVISQRHTKQQQRKSEPFR